MPPRSENCSFSMKTNPETLLNAPEDVTGEPGIRVVLQQSLPCLVFQRSLHNARLLWEAARFVRGETFQGP